MPFVSDWWGVEARWFHEKTSHAVPNSTGLSVKATFGLCDGSKNFGKLFSVSCEDFVFTRIRLTQLNSKVMCHDSEPAIVSRLTSLVEDFVIGRYQVTKLFCTRWSFASTFSARSPCYLGSQADIAISVFWEVSKNTLLPRFRCHCHRIFEIWFRRTVCRYMQFCFFLIFFEIL